MANRGNPNLERDPAQTARAPWLCPTSRAIAADVQKNETYVIGVDGGGSGCRAALATADGTVLATGAAGPANATSDFDLALANVLAAINDACDGVTEAGPWPAHIGLAGIMSQADAARLEAALGWPRVQISDDSATTLAGALAGRDGVVAAIGTGSLLGASKDGETRFLGGWGLHLGDQASGAWLGRALLQQVMLVHDGLAEATPLSASTWAQYGSDPNRIVEFAASATPKDFAKLAPEIVKSAAKGDAIARALLSDGASYLDRALRALDPGPGSVICLTGGLGPTYADWIASDLAQRLVPPAGTALDGALRLARQL